jgi:hypothetical protein
MLDSEALDVRAFRGSRRASVYREHVLGHETFARMLERGRELGLPLLSALDEYGRHELDMDQARQLAEEIEAVRAGESDELAHDLDSIASVARWCADAPERDSWLTIIGP